MSVSPRAPVIAPQWQPSQQSQIPSTPAPDHATARTSSLPSSTILPACESDESSTATPHPRFAFAVLPPRTLLVRHSATVAQAIMSKLTGVPTANAA
eukprot:7377078-Prymnesium_polylepis.2